MSFGYVLQHRYSPVNLDQVTNKKNLEKTGDKNVKNDCSQGSRLKAQIQKPVHFVGCTIYRYESKAVNRNRQLTHCYNRQYY